MREVDEEEPGVSAVPLGGSVEAETQAAISWSIIASCSGVNAVVQGRALVFSRGGELQAVMSRVSPRHPWIHWGRDCHRSRISERT